MLEHVWRRALQVRGLDALIIATDDLRIAEEARGFGAEVVMTPEDLPTGSDRVAWVMRTRSESHVVNIQGDEPLLDPTSVERVLAALSSPGVMVATAAAPVPRSSATATGVAVTVDEHSNAVSFARGQKAPMLQHIGLYAYRREALERFAARPRSGGEIQMELEQLRFLEYGDKIRVVLVPESSPSVDTPEDLERVRQLFSTGDTT
jgi:3-deoxy-manno-octulosonate cytidylyltransferase (CMP-KDO synthetase)